ncbi:transcriptional regulator [Dyella mobilis]|nr:AraC family transcriptional regulator [Dyella mobilis]GLQ98235.1 transcriptional regulator [Dyella mobilis]
MGRPYYCAILEGCCVFTPTCGESILLREGDFLLVPAADDFVMSALEPKGPDDSATSTTFLPRNEVRHGRQSGPPDVRLLVGHCVFGSPDAALLVSLLPQRVHIRGEKRLTTLVQLVRDESLEMRPARDVVLARLLEVLLIEALRSAAETQASPGLLRGLADERLASALRQMHEKPAQPWTIASLAKIAALSRSAFFERFQCAVGVPPMSYLLAWRMALAKSLLRREEGSIAAIAERVGYRSASTFSVAFTRHVGMAPTRYAREREAPPQP